MSTHPKKEKINTLPSQIFMKIGRLRDYGIRMNFSLKFLKYVDRVKSYGRVKFRVKVEPRCHLNAHISKTIQPRDFILGSNCSYFNELFKYTFTLSGGSSVPMMKASQNF